MQTYEIGPQITIITHGQNLNLQATNAFLKTLEEPGKDRFFIILAPISSSVLPTLLSRCASIFFPPVPLYETWENKNVNKLLNAIITNNGLEKIELLERLSRDKEELSHQFLILQKSIHQQIHTSKEHSSPSIMRYIKLLEKIESASTALRNNANPTLVLESLLFSN